MKNIRILPTDKPSRLYIGDNLNFVFGMIQTYIQSRNNDFTNQHIYITSNNDNDISDEGINHVAGSWVLNTIRNKVYKTSVNIISGDDIQKIILTTDQGLIKDGVQDIDDEFLEWFVKNPSCEYVKITKDKIRQDKEFNDISHWNIYEYKIIIPKEEPKFISGQFFLERADEVIVIHRPKQETLEEVAERLLREHRDFEAEGDSSYQNGRLNGILEGLKYQSERMYSEEDVRDAFALGMDYYAEPNDWDKVTPKQKLENLLIKKQ